MPATRLRILLHWPTRCDEMTFCSHCGASYGQARGPLEVPRTAIIGSQNEQHETPKLTGLPTAVQAQAVGLSALHRFHVCLRMPSCRLCEEAN
jgi:hypothetical protein